MRRTSLPWLCIALVALAGCVNDARPAMLRGEITRQGVFFIVRECSTGRSLELRLVSAAYVALDRHVRQLEVDNPGQTIMVELGGQFLPATSATSADGLFDVRARDAVFLGRCP